jgi:hypothetical protein
LWQQRQLSAGGIFISNVHEMASTTTFGSTPHDRKLSYLCSKLYFIGSYQNTLYLCCD